MKVSVLLSLASYSAATTTARSVIQAPLQEELSSHAHPLGPYLFSNPPAHADDASSHRIPTSYESAVLARRILALTPLGTVATIFPTDKDNADGVGASENRPAGLGGMPHGLMEYIADCESDSEDKEQSGNPTILAINVETSFKNVAAGSNVSLSVQWTPRYPPAKRIKSETETDSQKARGGFFSSDVPILGDILRYTAGFIHSRPSESDGDGEEGWATEEYEPVPYSAANLPRFSLLGYVERIPHGDDRSVPGSAGARLASCFVATHPDAKFWLPGSRVHESHFVRLVVTQVYWVGGFGDRAYIGWIPLEEWRNVTSEEWKAVTLPGEKKGWKEWSVEDVAGEL